MQYIWKSHYPLGPYHLSINVYPFDVVLSSYSSPVSGNIPLFYYLFPNHTAAAQPRLDTVVPQLLEAFEDRYGPFPFSGEKYGICESLINGGMEHQTILTMNYSSFFSDIVVHESAHEYFGNMIGISDWGHIWLSEGFATYSEAIFREYWEGQTGYDQEISGHMAGSGNGIIFVSDPSQPANIIPYNLVYLKASVVLHMLRYVMGDTNFFQMLQDYVSVSPFRHRNIDTEQFRAFCEGYHGSDLGWFFSQWIYGDGKMAVDYYHYWNSTRDSLIFKIRSVPSFPGGRTSHRMPVPLQLSTAVSQVFDTLWVDSLSLSRNYYIADTTNLSLQFDPGNTLLKGPFTFSGSPRLLDASIHPVSGDIQVIWEPFFDFQEYDFYSWKKNISGNFDILDSLRYSGTQLIFVPPGPGTYRFAIRGFQDGHRTDLSAYRELNYSTFPMDQGILVVDETRDGNGSHMFLPLDDAVDIFYDSLLSRYTHTQFDITAEGRAPTVQDLGLYSLVIWHHDVIYQTVISSTESELAAYLNAGGKILFSGMNYLNNLSSAFRMTYLGIVQPQLNTSADFTGARGTSGFPDLAVDTSKITFPLYSQRLPNVTVFDTLPGVETVNQYVSHSQNPLYHLKPSGVRSRAVSDSMQYGAVTLGFPLYFITGDSAQKLLEKTLEEFDIPTGLKSVNKLTPQSLRLYSNFPNPFNPSTKILFDLNTGTQIDILIYNLLGQRVRSLFRGKLSAGRYELEWNGANDSEVPQASGIYFLQLNTENQKTVMKILLQR